MARLSSSSLALQRSKTGNQENGVDFQTIQDPQRPSKALKDRDEEEDEVEEEEDETSPVTKKKSLSG